ncbi:penicillin-insensitive murein endopeptidase [Enhygromyxa salina]|uniref:Penicillin-insensitive murein endopeptidase n=1 Tax=Enhygromyxa salina TaxID=215803 RepID=A0A2S9YES6_9BACT|nr:penicillin-insensitive murein endopeptidase [Enhygromyxa salina]PRQ03610.1 penicillin-insensitive murein endopeptidase [Enhygromyxa salina]
MQGTSIRVTDSTGRSWTVPFTGQQLRIGRTADNDLVLEQGGVSSQHCVIGRDPTGAFLIQDKGSTNGTWIGDQRAQGTVAIQPGVKISVGSYVLSLEFNRAAKALTGARRGISRPAVAAPIGVGARGPLIRKSADEHADRRFRDRVNRYAAEWDEAGRPNRLLLRGRNLGKALDYIEMVADVDEAFGELEESFIRASAEGRERNKVVRIAGVAGGALLLIGAIAFAVTHDWSDDDELVGEVGETEGEGDTAAVGDDGAVVEVLEISEVPDAVEKVDIEHEVIPAETLEEIALRYDVPIQSVMRWNGIDESTPLEPGRVLKIRSSKSPLPQQMIVYRPDKRESWSSLAKRFDVPVSKLQAYNPQIEEDVIERGMELTIYVDPKALKRKDNVQIPEFTVRPTAISVGAPKNGKIIDAIQFPANDKLYKRRNPQIMWCGSHMAAHLQHAIASFRYTYDFEGEIVVADMSKKPGGLFYPHKSHQAGRDVDIWLPSLKGVYQPSHIREGKERRPIPDEADWFALYGFLKALHETGEVEAVFLAYELHDRVYKAAKVMGASEQELDEMIAYPRGAHYRKTLLQHSTGHTRHIHVRFKCGPNDECSKSGIDHDPGD